LSLESSKLAADNADGFSVLALLLALTAAPDDTNTALGGKLGLGGYDAVTLTENCSSLGVAKNGPGDTTILELGDADLTSECTVWLVEDVLRSNLNLRAQVLSN
jgi:hypothetical protein